MTWNKFKVMYEQERTKNAWLVEMLTKYSNMQRTPLVPPPKVSKSALRNQIAELKSKLEVYKGMEESLKNSQAKLSLMEQERYNLIKDNERLTAELENK